MTSRWRLAVVAAVALATALLCLSPVRAQFGINKTASEQEKIQGEFWLKKEKKRKKKKKAERLLSCPPCSKTARESRPFLQAPPPPCIPFESLVGSEFRGFSSNEVCMKYNDKPRASSLTEHVPSLLPLSPSLLRLSPSPLSSSPDLWLKIQKSHHAKVEAIAVAANATKALASAANATLHKKIVRFWVWAGVGACGRVGHFFALLCFALLCFALLCFALLCYPLLSFFFLVEESTHTRTNKKRFSDKRPFHPSLPPSLPPSQDDFSAVYDHAKCSSVAQCPANCPSVAQCPAVALLQEQAKTLLEITPLIIAEALDLRYRSEAQQYQLVNQQNQLLALQAQQGSPPPSPVIPYNQTTCSATPFSDFNSKVGTWVAVDWNQLAAAGQACNEGLPTATCSGVCANYNLRCDPCATSRALSCGTPLFYALQQAGKANIDIQYRVQALAGVTPPPPNAQIGTGCDVSGQGPLTSTTTIGNDQTICGDPIIPTANWPDFQNFLDPASPNYNNPADACSIPLRGKTVSCAGCEAFVQTGTVCYCAT